VHGGVVVVVVVSRSAAVVVSIVAVIGGEVGVGESSQYDRRGLRLWVAVVYERVVASGREVARAVL
jgi:hypothetical protein